GRNATRLAYGASTAHHAAWSQARRHPSAAFREPVCVWSNCAGKRREFVRAGQNDDE
ncbi:MAG: hypothetical protein AVDCRST_MAG93-3246, partial [uncultured Chloroflexia bacterium]